MQARALNGQTCVPKVHAGPALPVRRRCAASVEAESGSSPIAIQIWEAEEFRCDIRALTPADAAGSWNDARGVLAGM